jgi:methyltransferase (TIGR00027 family)
VALFRAAHLHLFDGPKIHEDSFALALAAPGGVEELNALSARASELGLPLRRLSAYFAARHRFSEERLRAALRRGVRQVVVLGAGLDSFALRHPEVVAGIRFVEVDHPDSQRWKRERLASLGLEPRAGRSACVDFVSQDLGRELARAGVDAAEPTFFAWLGITQYIDEPASMRILSLISRHAPGSEVVFDITLPLEAQPEADGQMTRMGGSARPSAASPGSRSSCPRTSSAGSPSSASATSPG